MPVCFVDDSPEVAFVAQSTRSDKYVTFMFSQQGHVLGTAEITSTPEEGEYIRWDVRPKQCTLLPTYPNVWGYKSPVCGALILSEHLLDLSRSDPDLHDIALEGGFLCTSGYARGTQTFSCEFRFLDTSELPFEMSCNLEEERTAAGDTRYIDHLRNRRLETGTWHVIGMHSGSDSNAFGIFWLDSLDDSGSASGDLHFVHGDDWNGEIREVDLYRPVDREFKKNAERLVGKATFGRPQPFRGKGGDYSLTE